MTMVGTARSGRAANSRRRIASTWYRRAPLWADCRPGTPSPYPPAKRAALGRHLQKRRGSFARVPFIATTERFGGKFGRRFGKVRHKQTRNPLFVLKFPVQLLRFSKTGSVSGSVSKAGPGPSKKVRSKSSPYGPIPNGYAVLIILWSRVQVPAGPPAKQAAGRFIGLLLLAPPPSEKDFKCTLPKFMST